MADREYHEDDPLIERVRETLAPLPRVEPSDVARMLVAVNNRRAQRTWQERVTTRLWFMRTPSVSAIGAGALAVLALSIGFFGRGAIDRDTEVPAVAFSDSAPSVVTPDNRATLATAVANVSPDELAVPVQFVLSVPDAQTVSLVGDFNDWDIDGAQLERVPNSAMWTTTVTLKPGRHVYAFVVDGRKWIRDPRAPAAVDEDFGRPQSVIVVQVPWTAR